MRQLHSQLATSQPNFIEYQIQADLNLYDSPTLDRLATQASAGRHLQILASQHQPKSEAALRVCLCEDDYAAWLAVADLGLLQKAAAPYRAIALLTPEIQARLPAVITFAQAAMARPNVYCWGGTLGPNYDCSGLVQHAFSSLGIWLPRDAYQQEAFTQPVLNPASPADLISNLLPGDLIFFGSSDKATHVGIHLGEGCYIHSSGKDQGRNGIGLDQLSAAGNPVSHTYYQQLRGAGRVVATYQSQTV